MGCFGFDVAAVLVLHEIFVHQADGEPYGDGAHYGHGEEHKHDVGELHPHGVGRHHELSVATQADESEMLLQQGEKAGISQYVILPVAVTVWLSFV